MTQLASPHGECGTNKAIDGQPGYFGGDCCTRPADTPVEFGCVHEHIFREWKCRQHGTELTTGAAPYVCTDCWEGKGGITPHKCPVIGRIAPRIEPAPGIPEGFRPRR